MPGAAAPEPHPAKVGGRWTWRSTSGAVRVGHFWAETIAAIGALAAAALGRPPAASAAGNGQAWILGTTNSCGTQGTSVSNLDTADANFVAGKTGVWGASPAEGGYGVQGYADGTNNTGVRGWTSGHHSQVAVDADVTGGNGEGFGVRARTKNGIAVHASATGGYALQCVGRAVFDRSGRTSFAAGATSRTIGGHSLSPSTLVLATIQGDIAGTWVRGVSINTATGKFTIRLNRPAPRAMTVGWFLVN
jgi:hypothetical protein